MKKILVPVDGSEASRKAAEKAIDIASRYGSEVTFLTVVHVPSDIINSALGVAPTDISVTKAAKTIQAEADKNHIMLDELINKMDKKGLSVGKKVVIGDPSEQIISVAKDQGHALIVMGSRGLSAARRFLLGSVAQKVIADASCPVLVVKEDH